MLRQKQVNNRPLTYFKPVFFGALNAEVWPTEIEPSFFSILNKLYCPDLCFCFLHLLPFSLLLRQMQLWSQITVH